MIRQMRKRQGQRYIEKVIEVKADYTNDHMLEITFESQVQHNSKGKINQGISKFNRDMAEFKCQLNEIGSTFVKAILKEFGGSMTREANNNGDTNQITVTMQADIAAVSDQEFLRKLVMDHNRKNNIRNNIVDTVDSGRFINNILHFNSSNNSNDSEGTQNQAIPFMRSFSQSSNSRFRLNRQRSNQSSSAGNVSPVD